MRLGPPSHNFILGCLPRQLRPGLSSRIWISGRSWRSHFVWRSNSSFTRAWKHVWWDAVEEAQSNTVELFSRMRCFEKGNVGMIKVGYLPPHAFPRLTPYDTPRNLNEYLSIEVEAFRSWVALAFLCACTSIWTYQDIPKATDRPLRHQCLCGINGLAESSYQRLVQALGQGPADTDVAPFSGVLRYFTFEIPPRLIIDGIGAFTRYASLLLRYK
jgi:hypothetical protein